MGCCIYKPDSVSAMQTAIICLDCLLPNNSLRHSLVNQSTTLHVGKDLAVSLLRRHKILPRGKSSPFGSIVTARTSWIAPDGGYPLPCYL
jgi:hypothetical protein